MEITENQEAGSVSIKPVRNPFRVFPAHVWRLDRITVNRFPHARVEIGRSRSKPFSPRTCGDWLATVEGSFPNTRVEIGSPGF
jgi:hypothetical protein